MNGVTSVVSTCARPPRKSLRLVPLALIALFALGVVPALGQEHEPAAEPHEEHSAEHEFHRNHFGGFLGTSIRHEADEAAATLGLEYARQFTPHWSVTGYVELVSSNLERDIILLAGVGYYPVKRLALILAPGIEQASRDVEHNGEVKQEEELEFLLRVGAVYGFRLTPQASLGPTVFVDTAGDKVTTVLGLTMIVGF